MPPDGAKLCCPDGYKEAGDSKMHIVLDIAAILRNGNG